MLISCLPVALPVNLSVTLPVSVPVTLLVALPVVLVFILSGSGCDSCKKYTIKLIDRLISGKGVPGFCLHLLYRVSYL